MKLVALFLTACAATVGAAERCRPVPGSGAVLVPGARIVLGEMHGNHETPRFVADLACLAAPLGPLRVGLEIPDDEQPRLDAYLSSAGTARDRQTLLGGAFWTGEPKDGRSSVAMVALLDALRQRRGAGADVAVVAFDLPRRSLPHTDRDIGMGKRLASSFEREPVATFIVRGAPPPMGLELQPTADRAYDGTFSIGAPTAARPAL